MSKQMRVSDTQYSLLGKLADKLDVDRSEILSNMLGLIQKIIENRAKAIKIICEDGVEKEIFLSFIGQK